MTSGHRACVGGKRRRRKMRGEREGDGCMRRGEVGSWGQRERSERSFERVGQRGRGRGRQWTTAGRCGQGEPGVSE